MLKSITRRLRNLRVRTNTIIIVLALALTGTTIMWIASSEFDRIEKDLNHVAAHLVPELAALNETEARYQQLRVDLFQTIAWARAGMEGAAMEAQFAAAAESVAGLHALTDGYLGGNVNPVLDVAFDEFEEFTKAVSDALDVTSFDATAGVMMAMQADKAFASARQKADEITQQRRQKISMTVLDDVANSKAAARRFMVVTAVGLLGSLALTILVIRSVGGPVVAMTKTMLKLADNHLDVDIPNRDLTNEVGQMAQALIVFRDNAIEQRRLQAAEEQARQERDAQERRQIAEKALAAEEKAAHDREEKARAEKQAQQSRLLQDDVGKVIEAARNGDFTHRITSEYAEPEMNELAAGVNALVSVVDDGLSHTVRFLHEISNGDLGARIEGDFRGAFAQLRDDANRTAEQLGETISTIIRSSQEILGEADGIAASSDSLSGRVERNAAMLEEAAAALEEMTAAVKQSATGAAAAGEIVELATSRAEGTSGVVREAIGAMSSIEAVSQEISKSIAIINEISFQTNLLALNAGVEAARAGEAGRGFAVVASEVRALAQRASAAASEIEELIGRSGSEIGHGTELVGRAGKALQDMAASVQDIASHAGQIASSTKEQSIGIGEINATIRSLDQATQQNAAMLTDTTTATSNLRNLAQGMFELVGFFRNSGGQLERGKQNGAVNLKEQMRSAS